MAPGTRPPGPNSFIFMQFSEKIWPNNRLEVGDPPSGKSGIRHWKENCKTLESKNIVEHLVSEKIRNSHYINFFSV